MNKTTLLKILNPILGLLLLNQYLSGVFGRELTMDQFALLHRGGALALMVAAGLHVILNWGWIRAQYLSRKPKG